MRSRSGGQSTCPRCRGLSGTTPFKARLGTTPLESYKMFWQVDGGQLNSMYNSTTGGIHKEAYVKVRSWKWNGTGPYTVTFVAKDLTGTVLARHSVTIFVKR